MLCCVALCRAVLFCFESVVVCGFVLSLGCVVFWSVLCCVVLCVAMGCVVLCCVVF